MSEENQAAQAAGSQDVSFVYNVPVTLKVLLGEATLTVNDVLACGKGSVIPLRQKAGEPFKIYLQDRAIAEGEVVQLEDQLGIKITSVIKAGESESPEAESVEESSESAE